MSQNSKFTFAAMALCAASALVSGEPDPAHGGLASSSMVAVVDSAAEVSNMTGVFMVLDRESGRVVWQSEATGARGTRTANDIHFSTSVPTSLDTSDGLIHTFRLDSRRTDLATYMKQFTLQGSDGTTRSGYATARDLAGSITEVRISE
ncbi:MAG: hypothetical protein ACI9OJ_002942 [Myxococcota bacterium]|jgi:hypothetical protein